MEKELLPSVRDGFASVLAIINQANVHSFCCQIIELAANVKDPLCKASNFTAGARIDKLNME
jgi:hypothetical protein